MQQMQTISARMARVTSERAARRLPNAQDAAVEPRAVRQPGALHAAKCRLASSLMALITSEKGKTPLRDHLSAPSFIRELRWSGGLAPAPPGPPQSTCQPGCFCVRRCNLTLDFRGGGRGTLRGPRNLFELHQPGGFWVRRCILTLVFPGGAMQDMEYSLLKAKKDSKDGGVKAGKQVWMMTALAPGGCTAPVVFSIATC